VPKYNSLKATRAVTKEELDFIGHAQGFLAILKSEPITSENRELIKRTKKAIKQHGGKV